MIELRPYSSLSDERLWDDFVDFSRNGTFLFKRGFMDYHSDRFEDCSLLFINKGKVLGCFPSNIDQSTGVVYSHQGLTYGGLILSKSVRSEEIIEMFSMLKSYYKKTFSSSKLIYKKVPYIYNSYPSDEDLYAIFLSGGRLTSRSLSSTIDLYSPLKFSELRRRCIHKGELSNIKVVEVHDHTSYLSYWQLLSSCLEKNHGVTPVHSVDEMILLSERFPDNISLLLSKSVDGEIFAGSWLFKCGQVVHTQYLASSDRGKELGALDYLINEFISHYCNGFRYLDFGISTEDGGKLLNNGLIFQKEGFGGRGVCYDTYEINL